MVTTEALKNFGADTDEGITRCAGKEELYLKLVGRIREDAGFSDIKDALEKKDLDRAFESAHKLKGALANLSLGPLLDPVDRITESLRHREDRDYSSDLAEMEAKKKEFDALFA